MSKPGVFVFAHELAAAHANGARAGMGSAVLIDRNEGAPGTVHLHLFGAPPSGRADSGVPLSWAVTADAAPPDWDTSAAAPAADHAALWIKADQSDIVARCRLTLDSKVFDLVAQVVETGARSFTRNTPIIETDVLAQRTVLCIGLGSGGSLIVDQLARAGVGGFILWDFDRLEAHNLGRHVCTLRDLGRLKAHAVRDHIHSINPVARVRCVERDVLECAGPGGDLSAAIGESDCVVVGTDNNASRFAINELTWNARPTFYGRAFTRACGGDIIQVVPALQTPCYACHVGDRVVEEEISSQKDASRVAYADRPVPIEPGLNIDILPLANMLARLVLLRLCAGSDSALAQVAEELDAPLYLWGNRREANFRAWQPMERAYGRLSILRWYGINVPRDKECVVCGTAPVE